MHQRPYGKTWLREVGSLCGIVALWVSLSFLFVGLCKVVPSGPTATLPVETAPPYHAGHVQ